MDSEPRHGRPSTSRNDNVIKEVQTLVMQDRRITLRELTDEVGVSTGSVHTILTADLGLRSVRKICAEAANGGAEAASPGNRTRRAGMRRSDSNFLNTMITGDESWVYGYDSETKAQSSQWRHLSSPRPKKARQVRSNVKVLLTIFFDSSGVLHHEYAPQGQTVTKE